jgi:hypothetical protein
MPELGVRNVAPIALSVAMVVATHLLGCLEVALPVLPLLFLLLSLLSGVYPGCAALMRLSERIARSRRPSLATNQLRPPAPCLRAVGGGLLIAFGIATRPPPLPA